MNFLLRLTLKVKNGFPSFVKLSFWRDKILLGYQRLFSICVFYWCLDGNLVKVEWFMRFFSFVIGHCTWLSHISDNHVNRKQKGGKSESKRKRIIKLNTEEITEYQYHYNTSFIQGNKECAIFKKCKYVFHMEVCVSHGTDE